MKKIQRLILLFLIAFLAACSSSSGDELKVDENSILVTDSVDRQVIVPKDVDRVAVTFAPTGHMMAILGEGDKIVAVNGGLQRDKLLTTIIPSILDAPVVKQSGQLNFEEIARMEPDFILIDLATYQDDGQVKKLEQIEIPYIVIDFQSFAEQMEAFQILGKALNIEERANQYIDFYKEKLQLVEDRTKDIPEDEKVRVYHSINEATRTSIPGTTSFEWLEKIGAINVAKDDELRIVDSKYYASVEQILLWNPEVILVNEDGVDEYILTKSEWKNVEAVKNDQVYLLPNGLTRWGHPNSAETPLALLWGAQHLYPDLFDDIDMMGEVRNFYKTFLATDLTDEQIEYILLGKNMRVSKDGKRNE